MHRMITAFIAAGLVLSSCATTTGGQTVTAPPTSTSAAPTATPAPHTATMQLPGMRENSAASTVTIIENSKAPVNDLVALALSDTQGYWDKAEPRFVPRTQFVAMPGPAAGDCYDELYVAAACPLGIIWETDEMTSVDDTAGPLGVLTLIAHEMGHVVQRDTGVRRSERGADCLAGVYLQSVVDDQSTRFESTQTGVIVSATTAFDAFKRSDTAPTRDRIEALKYGLNGASATDCAAQFP